LAARTLSSTAAKMFWLLMVGLALSRAA